MKILFGVLGIFAGIIALALESESMRSSPLGIYLLASAFILAAALYQNGKSSDPSSIHLQEIVTVLANGPLPMNELLKQLAELNPQFDRIPEYQNVIGEMFASDKLIIRSGQVDLTNRGEKLNP